MKKLMIAMLVLVAVGVYAQDTQVADVTFANHIFTVNKNGNMTIQFYQPDTTLGQDAVFGYYKSNADGSFDRYLLADQDDSTEYPGFTGNESFTIEGLKAGDQVRFFVIPKTNYGELADFSVMPGHGNSAHGNTVYGVGWDKNGNGKNNHNISFMQTGFEVETTPSGQPLPGALTTMLIAGGCAAYLRKRKAARK